MIAAPTKPSEAMRAAPNTYVERVARYIYWSWNLVACVALAGYAWQAVGLPVLGTDSTDGPNQRSGLGLYVDHGTGCQYLSRQFSGVTPRLSADGKPMCGGAK
jgi:hypothetical protein